MLLPSFTIGSRCVIVAIYFAWVFLDSYGCNLSGIPYTDNSMHWTELRIEQTKSGTTASIVTLVANANNCSLPYQRTHQSNPKITRRHTIKEERFWPRWFAWVSRVTFPMFPRYVYFDSLINIYLIKRYLFQNNINSSRKICRTAPNP